MHTLLDDNADLCGGNVVNSVTPPVCIPQTTLADGITTSSIPSGDAGLGLIAGSVIGGLVIIIILISVIVILTLALVCLARKYKRDLKDRETRIAIAQTNMEVKANHSYIPVFHQISTENNAAYGEMVNQDSNGVYETIMSIETPTEGNTQAQNDIEIQNKEDHYDYIID